MSIVTPQDGPAADLCLGEDDLELGAKDGELGLGRVDGGEERDGGAVTFRVGGGQIELDGLVFERDGRGGLVDLLEEEGGCYGGSRLVEVGPMS